MLKKLIVLLLLASSSFAEETTRVWTNKDGKKIPAALQEYDGMTATLERNGRNYKIAANTLSEADRQYLKEFTEKKAAMLARIKKGGYDLELDTKMFAEPKEYYDSTIGKTTRRALKEEGKDPMALVGFTPKSEISQVYVPAHYDGKQPFGIYIHISPSDGPSMPHEYRPILDARNMIMASPAKAGNKEAVMRRITLALDTVATLKGIYNIDSANIYAGGFSGGGITAMQAQLLYPEIWQGTISHARGMNLGIFGEYYSELKYFDESAFERMSNMKQRFAILSGSADFNYKHCIKSSRQWKDHGFDIKFYDAPSMGHSNAPADTFEEALDWVRKGSRAY